jgi:glutathione peroxidase
MTDLYDIPLRTLDGADTSLAAYRGKAVLVVNVASKCGHTPQYAGLEELHRTYRDRGLVVLGVPCNQFMGQEPGTAEEIAEFCSATYGVTFPMTEKVEVNGPGRHPLYRELVGDQADIQWNFEKFLVGPDGTVAARFDPDTEPQDERVTSAVEKLLPPATR